MKKKNPDNNITPHSAFLGCFALELNYLHLRVITEFLQERGDSQKMTAACSRRSLIPVRLVPDCVVCAQLFRYLFK